MGQRHQIYIIIKNKIYGFHHQWLFGISALQYLFMFITLYKLEISKEDFEKEEENDNMSKKLINIFTIIEKFEPTIDKIIDSIVKLTKQNKYHIKTEELSFYARNLLEYQEYKRGCDYEPDLIDPLDGDNDDGITIIDFIDYDKYTCGFHYFTKEDVLTPENYLKKYYNDFTCDSKGSLLINEGNTCSEILRKLRNINIISNDRCLELFGNICINEEDEEGKE